MQRPIFQLHQRLRGGAGNLNIIAGKIKHIGGRICTPEHPVNIQDAPLDLRLQPVGQYHLENIALIDMMFCLFYHAAVFFFCKMRLKPVFHF